MMAAQTLAMMGGKPTLAKGALLPRWPYTTEADIAAVTAALRRNDFTILTPGGEVEQLEREWAERTETVDCIAVSNGTSALALALAAVGVRAGDEVLVPALSFIATAVAAMKLFATPVFVEVDPITYNIDIADLAAKIGPRSRAIVPVHLHGLPADMDEIRVLAAKHGLPVVEDAAQAHGAIYRGRPVGGLSECAIFSLNMSKNLPTCGEGGLITTNDPSLARQVRRLRQFGEDFDRSAERTYRHFSLGWNEKLSGPLAAFTRSQLAIFDDCMHQRTANISRLLSRLAKLPGLVVPGHPEDRSHVWHILRFGVEPALAGLGEIEPGRLRSALVRALKAEGIPISDYQKAPLPAQPVFSMIGRQENPDYWQHSSRPPEDYDLDRFPATAAVIEGSFTLQKYHLPPDASDFLASVGDAFEKVWASIGDVATVARSSRYAPPWAKIVSPHHGPAQGEAA